MSSVHYHQPEQFRTRSECALLCERCGRDLATRCLAVERGHYDVCETCAARPGIVTVACYSTSHVANGSIKVG